MKKSTMAAVALVCAASAFADVKIGVADMLVLVRNHPSYESNKELLSSTEKNCNKRVDAVKKEVEQLQDEGKRLSDEYKNPMLSASAKAKVEADLTSLQQRFVAAQQRMRTEAMNAQRELQDLEAVMLKKQTDDIRGRVAKFAKAEGYDFILDQNAALYFDQATDVTDKLLKEMGVDPAKAKRGQKGDDEGK
ncbi:MAG: OmpH family outer membrane protein [Kiritimatiellae bacterium]|nr:OmpH family outer membrane protein [Kiritimatiellia bacterium]